MVITRLVPKQRSAVFFVKLAPPARADIGLIALHFAFGRYFAAELNAAVFLVWCQFDFELQMEIPDKILAFEEFILLDAWRLADDLAILDLPKLRVAIPAGEIFAVEEVFDVLRGCQDRYLLGMF